MGFYKKSGAGSGQYVWKKMVEVVPTITIKFSGSNIDSSTYKFKVTSNEVDLTKVDASYFVGFTFTSPSGEVYKFTKSNNLNCKSGDKPFTYNPSTTTITVSYFNAATETCNYSIPGVYDVVGFEVSNDETTYPDGAKQGEYLYERSLDIEELLKKAGYTSFAVDTFTCTSNSTTATIPHSLGNTPKLMLVLLNNQSVVKGCVRSIMELTDGETGGYILYNYYNSSGNIVHSYNSTYSAPSTENVAFKVNSNGFIAGQTFTIITAA